MQFECHGQSERNPVPSERVQNWRKTRVLSRYDLSMRHRRVWSGLNLPEYQAFPSRGDSLGVPYPDEIHLTNICHCNVGRDVRSEKCEVAGTSREGVNKPEIG